MRWLLMCGCVAGLALASPQARADWPGEGEDQPQAQMPTTPQVPPPVHAPWPPPPPGYYPPQMGPGPANCSGGCQNCGNAPHPNCLAKLKNWLCFCYETRDALPRLEFAPRFGPFLGTFMCGSPPAGCASGGGCCGPRGCPAPGAYPQPAMRGQPMPPVQAPPAQMPPMTTGMRGQPYAEPLRAVAPAYPARGCQGAAMPMVVESRLPSPADSSAMSARSAEIVNVEFRMPANVSAAPATEFTCGFVAAAPIARQMLSPVELITRTGTSP